MGARRGSAITLGTSVIAAAGLVIPQLTGALQLTTLGKLLSASLVVVLTALAHLLAKRFKDRRATEAALRVWPPERLREARCETLGVFPARDQHGTVERYQDRPREEDEAIETALSSRFVVIHGPARCGKSRALSHAAAKALGDVSVLAPLDARSLSALLDGTAPLPSLGGEVCLWLDRLERFLPVLDPHSLAVVGGAGQHGVRLLATIRSEKWKELLDGTDESSEAARAISELAEVVELGAFEPSRSAVPEAEPDRVRVRVRGRTAARVVFGGVIVALIGIILACVIWRGDLLSPSPISDQMENIESQLVETAGPGGGHVVVDERIQFHQTEQPSWVLVIEDYASHDQFYKRSANKVAGPRPHSDDLRIYDVVDGQLVLRLHFRPTGTGTQAAEWRTLQAGATPSADYDDDGSPEVIAGYARPSEASEALLPFAIDWVGGRYRLVALTPEKPELGSPHLGHEIQTYRRQAYERLVTLKTAVTSSRFADLSLTGFRMQTFALAEKPSRRLLRGYFSAYPVSGKAHSLEIYASQFRTGRLELKPCTAGSSACDAPAAREIALIPPDRGLDNGLLQAWSKIGERWMSPVQVEQAYE